MEMPDLFRVVKGEIFTESPVRNLIAVLPIALIAIIDSREGNPGNYEEMQCGISQSGSERFHFSASQRNCENCTEEIF
jgi:hypothetical protein